MIIGVLQSQYWTGQGSHRYVPILEFADAFEKSPYGRSKAEYLAQPFDSTKATGKDPLVYDTFALNGERHNSRSCTLSAKQMVFELILHEPNV